MHRNEAWSEQTVAALQHHGWLIMQREMREFNGTEPELMQDERNGFVRVTFHLGHAVGG
jgi:hypothetical protein